MYYTYLIRCEDNTLYCGITTDIKRRFSEHFSKGEKGAKYTHSHNVKKIEIVFSSENRSLASRLEYQIKKLTKVNKEKIISSKSLEIVKEKVEIDKYNLVLGKYV